MMSNRIETKAVDCPSVDNLLHYTLVRNGVISTLKYLRTRTFLCVCMAINVRLSIQVTVGLSPILHLRPYATTVGEPD